MKNALFCLLIFLSILKISFSYNSSDPSICTNYSNISDYCEIKDTNIIYNTTTSYLNFSTINIINSTISFNQSTCYTDLCFLIIDSSTVIILTNSAIIYPIIHISVPSLTLSNSNISTNGTIKYNIEESCKDSSEIGVGIGYAGVGAFCQDLTTTCNNPYGSPKFLLNNTKNHTLLLGRGQLQLNGDYFGSGGGRININITDFTLNSKVIISSSGSPQSGDSYNCASRNDKTSFKLLNGGSGGYIYFGVQNILNFGINSDFNIIAEGGNYCEKNDKKTAKFAGSGGRIIIDVLNFKNYFFNKSDLGIKTKISARGGINDFSVSENNINSCRNGPAGSIYIAREDELIFNNFNNQANTLSVIPSEKFKRIIVLNGSRAGPEDNHDNISAEEQIYVYNSYLNYERNYGNLNIGTKNLSLVADKAGGIGPPEEDSKNTNLKITAENINFSTNSIVFFGLNFVIISKKLIFSLSNVESYSSQSKFLIYSELMSLQSSNIEVSQIAITTDSNLEITNSIIRAFKQKCKTEKNYYSYINPNDFKNDFQQLYLITNTSNLFSLMTFFLQNNYTLLILQPPSKNISFITNDTSSTFKIQAANIGIFSLNINITKGYIISSEELGCRNEQGLGSGMQELNLGNKCGGTGGSYGGYGAFAWSNYSDILKDCLKIKNSVLYGDIYNPIYEGSGGGGNQMQLNPGGKGGGVIFLGALNSLIINGVVSSSGSAPETQMGKATAGSGAGGSIQIFMKILNGDGIIKSDGGNSQGSGIGGPGGGGRIRINFIDWFDENGNIFNFTGIVTANPGNRSDFVNLPDEIIYIGKGTISSTPCLRGYEGPKCTPCKEGFYKSIIGNGKCFSCFNKPENGIYEKPQLGGEISPQCKYICNSAKTGYAVDSNPNCYSNSYYLIDKLGGFPGILGICLAVFFFLSAIISFQCRKKKVAFKDSIDKNQNDVYDIGKFHINELANMKFCMEDMPYHLKRIYLIGENNCEKAWSINKNDYLDINHHEINIIQYNDFLKTINKKLIYNPLLKILIIISNWTYYPLYYLLIHYLRKQKFKTMTDFLPNLNILYRNQDNNSNDDSITPLHLKFSSSSDYTLGYIDILNYKKSLLDYSSLKFPVCLILSGEGSFLFPLSLNLDDPIVKTLCFSMRQEESNNGLEFLSLDIKDSGNGGREKIEGKNKKNKIEFQEFLKNFNKKARNIDFWSSFTDFSKDIHELLEYLDYFNKDFFKSIGIFAQLFVHKIVDNNAYDKNVDETGISFLDLSAKKDLEETLKEAHKFKHVNNEIDIKFSLNLIKIEEHIARAVSIKFDDVQLKINNKDIEEKKDNIDDSNELENLRKQLIFKDNAKKMEEEEKIKIYYKEWNNKIEKLFNKLKIIFFSIQRFFGWIRANFLKFRSSKNHNYYTASLVILLIFDLVNN